MNCHSVFNCVGHNHELTSNSLIKETVLKYVNEAEFKELFTIAALEKIETVTSSAIAATSSAIRASLDARNAVNDLTVQTMDFVNDAINNTAVEGGVLADTFVVVDSSLTQRTINRGLESIAELSTIKNPKNGLRVYVKSYHEGLNKGGGVYTYTGLDPTLNNGVTLLNGWVRNSPLDVYSGGVKGDGADDTVAFQRTYEVLTANNRIMDLQGASLKVNKIDLISNSGIANGSLDLRGYVAPIGWEDNWRRAPIMNKGSDRADTRDFEYAVVYSEVTQLDNVFIEDIVFTSNSYVSTLYKADNTRWENCKFYIGHGSGIHYLGGHIGSDIPNDGDNEFNLLGDTFNRRNKNIQIINCYAEYTGVITADDMRGASLCRLLSCEDVDIINCTTLNTSICVHADMFNRRLNVKGCKFTFDERTKGYVNTHDLTDADFIGVYIGQNSYDYTISNTQMFNIQRPVYLEGASRVIVENCYFINRFKSLTAAYGILVQANVRSLDLLKWANCDDVTIQNNKIIGYGFCVTVSSAPNTYTTTARNITIRNNTLDSGDLTAILISKTDKLIITGNNCTGSLQLGWVKEHVVEHNSFKTVSNLALIVAPKYPITLLDNTFTVTTGSLVRFLSTESQVTILGGMLSTGTITEGGEPPLYIDRYSLLGQKLIVVRNLVSYPVSSITRTWVAHAGMTPLWKADITMESEHVYRTGSYNWKFNYSLVCGSGGFWIYFENLMPETPLSFTPSYYITLRPSFISGV